MNEMSLELEDGRTSFRPSEQVAGTVMWVSDEAPRRIRVELLWSTGGKGTVDEKVVDFLEIPSPPARGNAAFRLQLPDQPWTFSGKLVSVIWAVRAVAEPGEAQVYTEIIVSPTGREIDLTAPP